MHKLTGRLLRLALSGALALGLATTAIGAAQAVDIKLWNLTNVGYPEYIAMATAEYKKTHPDVNIIFEQFPNEAYKTAIQVALAGSEPPDVFFNWAGEDAARLVRDGLALDITQYGSAPGGFKQYLSEGWLSSFEYDGKNYGIPTDAVSKYFYYDKAFFADNKLEVPTTFERAARPLQGDPGHRSSRSFPGRWGTRSAGSSTTSSPCSTSACSAPRRPLPTTR